MNVPLQSRQDLGFNRLHDEGDNSLTFSRFESTISRAERGQVDALRAQNVILVKQDVDVRGTKVDNKPS